MKCSRCQQENPVPDAQFCPRCGSPVPGVERVPAESHADLQRALREALDQQTATADILKLIALSPTDVQSVFDAVAERATRICEASDALIQRVEGDTIVRVAHYGPMPLLPSPSRPLTRGNIPGRAILEWRPIHVHDVGAPEATREYPDSVTAQRAHGPGTVMSVPLMRDGAAVGAITIRRPYVRPFTDKQIALLQTFADQAVIAIENVRLFDELQARNAQLSEALEQQTATSEILSVISSSPTDLQPVFDAIAASATRLCEGVYSVVFRYDGELITVAADNGRSAETSAVIRSAYPAPPRRGTLAGRALLERRVIAMTNAQDSRENPDGAERARAMGYRAGLSVPMMRGDVAIGVINVVRLEAIPFTTNQIELLKIFADQAVIAIENVRLFNETKEALEQQTATSEILRVISSSPTDVQPTFEAIAASATRVCDAGEGTVFRFDGTLIHVAAHSGLIQNSLLRRVFPRPVDRGSVTARAILTRSVVHISDVTTDPDLEHNVLITEGFRTVLSVPMLRAGDRIGAITVSRQTVAPFSDAQIALLQTFADQAVIAIENVRLFNETQESLEQQTATNEILRVISSSPTDVQPVFDVIVEQACRLCDAVVANAVRIDGDLMHNMAAFGFTPEAQAMVRRSFPQPPSRATMSGRAILERAVVEAEDASIDDVGTTSGEISRSLGGRAMISVPMLKDGIAIGAITLARREPGRFPERQVNLLRSFANQAVIAIENVRLFKELEARNRDLTEALEQQTATSEILRVISQSPTDVQPVFETIAQNARRLCEARFSHVLHYDGERLELVAHDGLTPEGLAALRGAFPLAPSRRSAAGRSVQSRVVEHIPDVDTDPEYGLGAAAKVITSRAVVAVPMLRDGLPVGVIVVARSQPGPFTDRQVALLQTFADQAVIAIENVRLFKELQEKNGALSAAHSQVTETLEQQTATSEILRVISRSPTSLQPVFDAIAQSAVRLCKASSAGVFRVEGGVLYNDANWGGAPEALAAARARYPRPLNNDTGPGVAILTRAVFQVPDTEDASVPDHVRHVGRVLDFRSVITLPMLREAEALGAIAVTRREPGRFTDAEVELLKTFTDQAVIAIENVRLFSELEARNVDLTRALDQQTATADVLRIIAQSPTDLQPVLDAIARSAVRLCAASDAVIERLEGDHFYNAAHAGTQMRGLVGLPLPLTRRFPGGRAVLDRQRVIIDDIHLVAEAEYPDTIELLKLNTIHSVAEIPLLSEGKPLGTIAVLRAEVRPFTNAEVALLETFADQAVIAIENVRLFKELQASNRELTTALDTQTATSDILRVISRSQMDVQPVFDAIVDSAVRLLRGFVAAMSRLAGEQLELVAFTSTDAAGDAAVRLAFPQALHSDWPHARVVRNRALLNVADARSDPQLPEAIRNVAVVRGYQSLVVVPLLRHDEAVGAISLTRREPGGFTDDEISLLQTFADQAVIAIENARLLGELQTRTQELTRSVEQLTALGEVGRAVSSTLDLETVLTTIVSRAVELSGLDGGVVFEYDETAEEFIQRAATETGGALAHARRATRIRKGEGVLGRTATSFEPIQVADITVPGAHTGRLRENLIESGIRAVLAVPMIYEGRLIGGLAVTRNRPGEFPAETIELMRTFATQSALAIQNARLFRELEQKSRELEAASQHKSEFLANMSHELRTPLNAIIGFSEVLSERMFGELNDKQDEYLKDIHASGQHLLSLINDILDLSKIEAGKMELELSDFDMPMTIDNALMLVRERATRRSIALHTTVDERLGQIQADERKIRQVLLNLLSNAIKFTPEGGRIDVRATPVNGSVEVSVSDTGVGIAPEDQQAVFEEFRQVGTAEKKVEGTGLGLALSRKFIELHGGKIWVKSQVGAGSTFTFTVPVRRGE